MKKMTYFTFLSALFFSLGQLSAADALSMGVVNVSTCVSDSKLGKQEQGSFESLKKQMTSMMEEKEKELGDLTTKFNDKEYMDGLSPEAEEEMKNKFRTLQEEMMRAQNQYYQVLNQANMSILQKLNSSISTASEKVAKDKKLSVVLNKDASFYFVSSLDVTSAVIAQMDKVFDEPVKTDTKAKDDKK